MDLVDAAHAAFAEQSRHVIQIEDDVADVPFGRDGGFSLCERGGIERRTCGADRIA